VSGDGGIGRHVAGDDEEVGLLAHRADLVGQALEWAGLDLVLEVPAERLAECVRDECRARFRERLERAAEVEGGMEGAHVAYWSLRAHAGVEG
jgi:hypothetical protein